MREGRCLDDGWIGGEHQRDGERGGRGRGRTEGGRRESEVWERRWLSCLFEDESERQCSEEVRIHKHTQADVCTRSHALTHTHGQTNTHASTDTLPPPPSAARAHSAPRRGGKRPRLIGCCRLILPRVAEQCMLGCLDTNAVIHEGMR